MPIRVTITFHRPTSSWRLRGRGINIDFTTAAEVSAALWGMNNRTFMPDYLLIVDRTPDGAFSALAEKYNG